MNKECMKILKGVSISVFSTVFLLTGCSNISDSQVKGITGEMFKTNMESTERTNQFDQAIYQKTKSLPHIEQIQEGEKRGIQVEIGDTFKAKTMVSSDVKTMESTQYTNITFNEKDIEFVTDYFDYLAFIYPNKASYISDATRKAILKAKNDKKDTTFDYGQVSYKDGSYQVKVEHSIKMK